VIAISQREISDTSNTVGGLVVFNAALIHHRVPLVMAVEITQDSPYPFEWRINDARTNNAL
jgi:hypothetical protein